MADITQEQIERAIKTTCSTVLRNEHYFADLDGLAGDGDFGTSLATGFRQIEKEWDEIPKTDIGAMLLKISMIVSKHRSEEHTSELQSRENLVCRLLLEKK